MDYSIKLQRVLQQCNAKQLSHVLLLMKSHRINVSTQNNCISVDVSGVSEELINVLETRIRLTTESSTDVDKESNNNDANRDMHDTTITNDTHFSSSSLTTTIMNKKGKKVTILDDLHKKSTVSEKRSQWADIDDLEKKMKQSISLRPSQLRLKKKVKDLLKKISKHKYLFPDKNYGHDFRDDDETGESIAADDNVESVMGEGGNDVFDYTFDDFADDNISVNQSDFAGENEDVDNLTEDAYENNIDDDGNKIPDDTDGDGEGDGDGDVDGDVDGDGDMDDVSSVKFTDDATDFEKYPDDDVSIADIDVTMTKVPHVSLTESSDLRLSFKDSSISDRFFLYKGILEKEIGMDFGDTSQLGLQFLQ